MTKMRKERRERRDDLFNLLAAPGRTMTIEELSETLGANHKQMRVAIRDLRLFLGADRDINLVCQPGEHRGYWNYRLVGSYEGIEWWAQNRVKDMEGRLLTITAVSASIVAATRGNSVAGRKARKIERTMTYLQKELSALDE